MTPTAEARAVAAECARMWRQAFGARMLAAYMMGSLAHGGYAPAVSDIDVAVVLTGTRSGDRGTADELAGRLRRRGGRYGSVSVFWASLPALRDGRDDGRFPAIDRLDCARHGRLLLGDDVRGQIVRPSVRQLQLDSSAFALAVLGTDEVVAEFHRPRRLLTDPVWFTKAVLFPVRFQYSGASAEPRVAGNDEAIAWYLARPSPVAAPLVREAARVRSGAPLDPARALPALTAGLTALYAAYLDDQTRRLRTLGAPDDLVAGFVRWRDRLSPPDH